MIVLAFRSAESDSFHTNTLCPVGKAIAPGDRLVGEGGLDDCRQCRALAGVHFILGDIEKSVVDDLRVLARAEVLGGFGVVVWLPGSNEILMSEGAYEVHGLTPTGALVPEEIVAGAVHPDDIPSVWTGFTAVAKGDVVYDARHRAVWSDGTTRLVHTRAILVEETADHPEYVLGTVVDVTDYMALSPDEIPTSLA